MLTANKTIVRMFNHKVIVEGNRDVFEALVAEDFVNHSVAPDQPNGREGLWSTFQNVLHSGLSQLRVEVLDQVAENDKVTTRKRITGQHSGSLLGIPATGRAVSIDVVDIVRIENGRYVEHWGLNSLPTVLAALRSAVS